MAIDGRTTALIAIAIASAACSGKSGPGTATQTSVGTAVEQASGTTPPPAPAPTPAGGLPNTGGSFAGGGSPLLDDKIAACDASTFGGAFGDVADLKAVSSLTYAETTAATTVTGKGEGTPLETVGRVGIALRKGQQDTYWGDDAYSVKSYAVSVGTMTDGQGRNDAFEVYRIAKPAFAGNFDFLASGSDLFVKPASKSDFKVYALVPAGQTAVGSGPGLDLATFHATLIAELAAADVTANAFKKIDGVDLAELASDVYIALLPADKPLTSASELAAGTRAAIVADSASIRVVRVSLDVSKDGKTFDTRGASAPEATKPGELVYGANPRFPAAAANDGRLFVAWTDTASAKHKMTVIKPDLSHSTVELPVSLTNLAAFTVDGGGTAYYLTIADGEGTPEAQLLKVDADGKQLGALTLGNDAESFNIFAYSDVANLRVRGNLLGMMLARRMQDGGDGLNHQGSIAALFDTAALTLVVNHGQNSGHSFDNKLVATCEDFASIDLGDNYPRGIILHAFSDQAKVGRVVYTYKTHLGDEPSPYRKDSAGQPLAAGKWSNDNRTYTELGDLRAFTGGYAVAFSTEKSIDNATSAAEHNEARNVAFLVAASNLDAAAQEEVIVTPDIVITPGAPSAEFGYYTFDGDFVKQRNAGVVWLTDYADKATENASAVKLEYVAGGRFLVLWEKWTAQAPVTTYAQLVDKSGAKVGDAVDLGASVRLPRGDRLQLVGGRHVWVTGNGTDIELNIIDVSGP